MKPFKVGDSVRFKAASHKVSPTTEVQIVADDMGGDYPLLVRYRSGPFCDWVPIQMHANGTAASGYNGKFDLIHVPETRTVEGFLVMNKDGSVVFCHSYDAEAEREIETFSVKPFAVTFEEGEGL